MKNRTPLVEEDRIRRLLAVGCPVPSENHSSWPPDVVVEVRNSERTQAFDFRCSAEYILDLRIRNTSFVLLKVQEVQCHPNWKDRNITRLGDPRLYRPEQQVYQMPSGRKIPYESVLNHRLFEMELEPGKVYEGMFLAYSIRTRISTDYLHGERFPMRIALTDQFGRSHASLIEVQVDRTATMRVPDFTKKGTGLYGASRASRVADVSDGMARHPRQPASSPRDNAYSSELLQQRAHRPGTRTEV
jgi:hypothetical protein